MKSPVRIQLALAFGLVHWVLLLVVQAENAFGLRMAGQSWGATLLSLLMAQGENIIAAVCVVLVALAAARWRWARWVYFAVYAALTIFVVLDRAYFKIFADHFRLSLSEGVQTLDPALAFSSVRQVADLALVFDFLFALAALALLARRWLVRGETEAAWRLGRWRWGFILPVGLGVLSTGGVLENWRHHPLTPLLQESFMSSVRSGLPSLGATSGDGTGSDARPSSAPELAEVAALLRGKMPKPNVLLIILESVGAQQLFADGGLPDARIAPNLAALARSGVVFDSFYSVFPGTARNHVALNTGGQHITWGSVYDLLQHQYGGPMLAQHFGTAGYATALFSSERLDGEAMDAFEQRAHWEKLYDFARDLKNHTGAKVLNSWGAREEVTVGLMAPWLDETTRAGRPFLLSYMNVATHHPYTIPRDFEQALPPTSDLARFRNALHYSDATLGRILTLLRERGVLENTLIAITGDHGEAFGDLHRGNLTHRNAIYDENVRTFLLLSHPAIARTVRSARIGTAGDLFPTLAAAAGLPAPEVPGLDLLGRELPARVVYFQKCAFPEQWGLRDGRWKFIETIRERQSELFDLSADPTEQRNLAAGHPELVARYTALCERWYLQRDAEFTARLTGYQRPDGRPLESTELRTYGPKVLTIGFEKTDGDGGFDARTEIPPDRAPSAATYWIGYEKARTFRVVWIAPSGARHPVELALAAGSFRTRTAYSGPLPMEAGAWQVSIEEAEQPLLTSRFQVLPAGGR